MSTTLRDFIAQREGEIRDQQRALKAELRDLQTAKNALEAQSAPSLANALTAHGQATQTIKDMAREILSGMPNGLNSSGILDGIKKMFGRDVERTSLSPQLSRLKDEGELFLDGDVWFTKEHHAEKVRRAFDDAAEELIGRAASMPDDDHPIFDSPKPPRAWDDDEDVPF